MPGRRRAGFWIAGGLGLTVVAALSWALISGGRGTRPAAVVYDAATPLPLLTNGLREGDARALLILFPRLAAQAGPTRKAVSEAEARDLIEILNSTRAGFLRFGGYGRVSSLLLVTKILERFAVEEVPACWFQALRPIHDLFASGLADADAQTRITALNEVSRLWSWFPGRAMMEIEETTLVGWKSALYAPVVRRLGDREPQSRAAAVACLGSLPDDAAAAKALPYLEDKAPNAGMVRQQVLISFAQRPALLSEEAVLKQLQDPEPAIVATAELILKTRGLSTEQIDLGRLVFDPRPEHRASVIPRLRNRTDIDPVVWLLQLSYDESEAVRTSAVAALAERLAPEVLERLGEMARSDPSPAVREAAGHLVSAEPKVQTASLPPPKPRALRQAQSLPPAGAPATVALPPLPGAPSLNPKAN